jgi:hypothetical protein
MSNLDFQQLDHMNQIQVLVLVLVLVIKLSGFNRKNTKKTN